LIEPYLPLIYLITGITASYFGAKLILNHMTSIKKVKRSIDVQKDKKSFENGIEDLIENSPQMYSKVLQELQYLKENGADEKQMASLQRKADLLKTVVENQEIINVAGKPIIKYLGKLIGGLGR
tara:strand:+ start:213 stop:584 length:372 start_codon:yes stop_codon:yes gene_type:complete